MINKQSHGINADTLQPYPRDTDASFLKSAHAIGDTSGCPDAAAKVAALLKK